MPADGQEELMLGRGQPGGLGFESAPVKEASKTGPELEQSAVVGVGKFAGHGRSLAQVAPKKV
jgi:hypothetical protein